MNTRFLWVLAIVVALFATSCGKEEFAKTPSKLISNVLPKLAKSGLIQIDSTDYGVEEFYIAGTFTSDVPVKEVAIVLSSASAGVNVVSATYRTDDGKTKFAAWIPWQLIPADVVQISLATKAENSEELTCQFANASIFNAAPKKFAFPTQKNEVLGNIDEKKETDGSWVMHGWSFAKGNKALGNKVLIALTNPADTLLFETAYNKREDVVQAHPTEPSAAEAGFRCIIQKAKLIGGLNYNLGIVVQNQNESYYRDYNGQTLMSLKGKLRFNASANLKNIGRPSQDDGTKTAGNVDNITVSEKGLMVEGWASAKEPATPAATYLMFTAAQDTLVFATSGKNRKDVADALKNDAYAKSGFVATIPREGLKAKKYTVHAIIKNGNDTYIGNFSKEVRLDK
jgi:hypothetical protein